METHLTWYGQSAFKIVTPSGNVLLVDPWLTNPDFAQATDTASRRDNVELTKQCRLGKMGTG
jgi:L-ascorbate metabolism protein UlaG (beta-lactamase superfamily)